MSRQAGSIVRGISKPRRISVKAGRQQVAAMYCGHGQRSRHREPLHQARSGCRTRIGENQGPSWQGRQGSNLRQPVLETGTLPTELHPCGNQASPLISAVSSISNAPIARAKRLTAAERRRPTVVRLTLHGVVFAIFNPGTAVHRRRDAAPSPNALFKPRVLRQTSAAPSTS